VTSGEKKAYLDGYQRALKEVLNDLAAVHSERPNDLPVRTVVDYVWDAAKKRLLKSKGDLFCYGKRTH